MHELLRIGNLCAVGLADGLMSQADTEHRNFLSESLYHIDADTGVLRTARPWGKNDSLRLHGLQFFYADPVVADDLDIRPDTSNHLV